MNLVPITSGHRRDGWLCTIGDCNEPATFENTNYHGVAYCSKHVPAGTAWCPDLPPAPGSLTPTAGYKTDVDKLRYDLIPPHALEALAYVYTIGANKYGDDNYLKGMSYRRVIAAAFRHIAAWQKGRVKDPDDGQHPLASVAWCMFTLMEYERRGIGVDDRKVGLNPEGLAHIEHEGDPGVEI